MSLNISSQNYGIEHPPKKERNKIDMR